jgi:ribosomal protein S8
MTNVKRTFQDRVLEINLYFSFIDSFTPPSGLEDVNKILKSNLILMLYNLVESSISNSIEEIHNNIYANSTSFDILKSGLKETIIKNLNRKNPKNFIQNLNSIATDIVKKCFDKQKVFNGNVDSRKIRDLSSSYGFNSNTNYSSTKNGEALVVIKGKRNDLAHGIFSFVEVGKEYTIQDLEIMKDQTINYLTEIISNIEIYLNNQEYLQVGVFANNSLTASQI